MLRNAFRVVGKRDFPDAARHEAVTDVEVRIALVELRIERIEQAEVEVVAGLGERRRQVVDRVRPRVFGLELETSFAKHAAVETERQTVVGREALVPTGVDRVVDRVDVRERVRDRVEREAVGDRRQRSVRILDRVEVHTLRTRVLGRRHELSHDLVLERGAPEMRISRHDLFVDVAGGRTRQDTGTRARRERSEVVRRDRDRRESRLSGHDRNHRVVGRILDDVERHVSEVPLVGDAVAAAKRRLAITEHIPRHADARSEVVPILLPEIADGAILGQRDTAVRDALLLRRASSVVEVGVERAIRVVLHAEIIPAQAEVQRDARMDLPRVVDVERTFVVAVVARERRSGNRQRDRVERVLALRIDGNLELAHIAENEVVEAAEQAVAERLNGVLVSTKRAIVLDADVRTAEADRMVADRPGLILVELRQVLRAAERNGRTRIEGQVARKRDGGAANSRHCRAEVQRRAGSLLAKRLLAVQAVEHELGLRDEVVAPHARDRAEDVVGERRLAGVEAGVRAERVGAVEEFLVLEGVPDIHRRLVVDVPVSATDQLVAVLRIAASGIRRNRLEDLAENRKAGRQCRERAARRAADLAARDGAAVDRLLERVVVEESLGIRVRLREELGSRDERRNRVAAANSQPLDRVEELEFVLHDRAANRVTELVARKHALLQLGRTRGRILRIEVIAARRETRKAVELVDRSVELVRAALRGDVDDTATGATELGREVARQDRELLHRVERYLLADGSRELIVIVGAVEQHVRARGALAVDRKARATSRGIRRRHVAREGHERVRVSRDRRELAELLLRDDGLENLVLGIDLNALITGDDVDRGRTTRNSQFEV